MGFSTYGFLPFNIGPFFSKFLCSPLDFIPKCSFSLKDLCSVKIQFLATTLGDEPIIEELMTFKAYRDSPLEEFFDDSTYLKRQIHPEPLI